MADDNPMSAGSIEHTGIRLIEDHPSGADEFRGGAHDRVAKALVEIITSAEGGRAIGLEGSWGSGKSSVIEIASKKLGEHDSAHATKHSLFIFDAWAHQGDPLRRVFLEELIEQLARSGAVKKSYWMEKIEGLRALRKRMTERRAEKLNWVAIVAILSLPLYPIGYALLFDKGSDLSDALVFAFGNLWISEQTIGVAILAIPYIATLLAWIAWRPHWKVWKKEWFHHKKGREGRSVLWAFTRQTDEVRGCLKMA